MMPTFSNILSIAVAGMMLSGCASGPIVAGKGPRGFLRFEVEPPDAEVDIDEQYSGVVNGWVDGVIPVQPGMRRVTLRAAGYITQRFDLEVGAYEEVTLVLALEPALELPDEEPEQRAPEKTALGQLPLGAFP